MIALPRTDTSRLGAWWWTVDRWALLAVLVLAALGALMVLAASPAVAERLNYDSFYFVRRHLVLLIPAGAIVFLVSLLSPTGVRRLGLVLFVLGLLGLLATLLVGHEAKGARRWIQLAGLSLQPSEFVKPAFAVVTAWLFALQRRQRAGLPGDAIAMGLLAAVLALVTLQPDLGMVVTIGAVWLAQYFVAGVPLLWAGALGIGGVAGLTVAYVSLPHVQSRIDRFFDPSSGDSYQIDTALNAFSAGGFFGRGPGEGVVKSTLPDAHADFIFAVVGEEFGIVACLVILGLFAFIVLRGFARLFQEEDLFVLLAAGGLLTQFGLQAIINMAVTLHLVPTKGMTLPFVSYGGSSLLALSIATGMALALTRRRPSNTRWP